MMRLLFSIVPEALREEKFKPKITQKIEPTLKKKRKENREKEEEEEGEVQQQPQQPKHPQQEKIEEKKIKEDKGCRYGYGYGYGCTVYPLWQPLRGFNNNHEFHSYMSTIYPERGLRAGLPRPLYEIPGRIFI